jgi:Cytochrome b(N-terminal)/b6/petB
MNINFASIVNLNSPGNYYHWSIYTISVANLIIIGIMVFIFGLALILPFPKSKINQYDSSEDEALKYHKSGKDEDSSMWTYKIRNYFLKILPPGKLLPDRQPAYVSSWIYVFGVASLVALAMAIFSGVALTIGGPDWWHYNALGHFFNSIHLWSIELFMALLVIHLWGKFWMAAWRGKRALTWITGVVAFLASIIECFSGYLSQQNFDSQWIAANGKDALNVTGLGTFFNLMNFGQMLTWHIVLIPIVLILLIAFHIILVRVKGVVRPIATGKPHGRAARKAAKLAEASKWNGPNRRYDILKEGTIAFVIVFGLIIGLATILSSPNEPPVTISSWARVAPADFMGTAASELAGTSETANYGPPYNNGTESVQKIGVSWQMLTGVHQKIDSANTFVLDPLKKLAATNPKLQAALSEYTSASSTQQQAWNSAYSDALNKVYFVSDNPVIPKGDYGPMLTLVSNELALARSGALDADLLAERPFYGSNYTKPLLFIEDGNYFSSLAQKDHLTGTQWGVMNETGSYPGQPWMWLYTLWYQVPGFSSSANVDLIAIYMTVIGTTLLLAVPFIPGLRDIPKIIPVHRLIWRKYKAPKK